MIVLVYLYSIIINSSTMFAGAMRLFARSATLQHSPVVGTRSPQSDSTIEPWSHPLHTTLAMKRQIWNMTTGEDTRPVTYIPLEPDDHRLHEIFTIADRIRQLKQGVLNVNHPDAMTCNTRLLLNDVCDNGIKPARICADDLMRKFMDE